jgi:soluble lytic murein transglycosylase-like protein
MDTIDQVMKALVLWGATTLVLLAAAAPIAVFGQVVPYQSIFQQVAGVRWIDRAAQAQAESQFNPKAKSNVGAQGLMQAMPSTWAWYQKLGWVAKESSPLDPQPAIQGGSQYMLWLEARVQGNWHAALGGFNAGQGTIDKAMRLADSLGVPGVDPWLRVLPRISNVAASAQTAGYIVHNDANKASIQRKLS